MASVSLLAFANSLPDLLMTSASDKNLEGTYFILGTLLGDFLFNTTITLAYVIYKGNDGVKLDSINVIKELVSYGSVLGSILFFAYFYKKLTIHFIYILVFIYLVYLIVTYAISKRIDRNYSYIEDLEKSAYQNLDCFD